jgi:peptide/nickel transport system ATP-binding protein
MDQTALLKVSHLRTYFSTKDGTLPAVNGVSFAVERGEVLGVVGESGCGKSVMSMTIMKLIEKYGGQVQKGSSIELEGKEILGLSEKEICDLRGKTVSMISQDPMTSLNPVFTIGYQMVEMIRRHLKLTKKEAKEVAIKWLEKVGIPEPMKRFKEYPHQLSGGMCQRVIIAMALSCNPKILIADEPTTALDVTIQAQILDLLRSLKDETSTAIILITHDMGVVADIADKVMVMYAGHAVEYGTKYQIFNNPCHPYTQGLLASVPRLDKQVDRLYSITGNVPNLTKVTEGCIFRDRCNNAIKNCVEYNPPQFVMADGRRVSCWLYENEAKEICHEE